MLTKIDETESPSVVWRMALSGLCTSLIGIGLARFAYTPLIPVLVSAHWFTSSEAAYLGAANLAGYLLGALLAQQLSTRFPTVAVLRTAMLVATASFFGCAFPISFMWFFAWRLLSGFAGALIMVLVVPTVTAHVPKHRRGLVSGAIFVGVGFGIIASGTLVPTLLHFGLMKTWLGLGALSSAASLIAWGGWGRNEVNPQNKHSGLSAYMAVASDRELKALNLEYGLNAVGIVPHMIFLVDFIARGLGDGFQIGAHYWILFGAGALVGPILTGYVADRIGFKLALRIAFIVEAVAVGILAVAVNPVTLCISCVIVGAYVPGIVPLAFGRVNEITNSDPENQKAGWSICTAAFALGQATAAYGFSYIFAHTKGNYSLLFELGAIALALAFMTEIAMGVIRRNQPDITGELKKV